MTLFPKRFLVLFFFNFLLIAGASSHEYEKSSAVFFITKIELIGNKVTKDEIIHRELLFKEGENVPQEDLLSLISRSKENLLNTALFNFVTIKYTQLDNNISISIEFQERWYIWPYPVLEHADRNFSAFLKNKEWSRIDYGLFLLFNNFRGRKETLILKTIFGHNNRYVLYYYKPFIDNQQKIGFGINIEYKQNHEVAFQVLNDKVEYLKLENQYSRKAFEISNFYTYRPQLNTSHLLHMKYSKVLANDSLIELNNNYFFNNESEFSYFAIKYNIDYDLRDSKIYPLDGLMLHFSVIKNGIGILSNNGNFEVKSIIEKHYRLSKKFFMSSSILGEINISNSNPFYFSESIGYKNYLRGMEYYVSAGNNYYISKTNLKYEIIPQTNLELGFLPSKKFSKAHYALYLNLFLDTGYASDPKVENSILTNQALYSGGIGIDLVTYYDKVLRIEYSLNKFGEHGIFFHLGAPIIDD